MVQQGLIPGPATSACCGKKIIVKIVNLMLRFFFFTTKKEKLLVKFLQMKNFLKISKISCSVRLKYFIVFMVNEICSPCKVLGIVRA